MKIYTNDLVKGHSDFKVECLTFVLYTQVSDSGPLGPLVLIVKIFKSISEVQSQTAGATLGWPQFTKRHYSHKNVDGVMVLNLCTLSDDALYLYQVS